MTPEVRWAATVPGGLTHWVVGAAGRSCHVHACGAIANTMYRRANPDNRCRFCVEALRLRTISQLAYLTHARIKG